MRNLTIAVAAIAIAYACGGRSDIDPSDQGDATVLGICGPGAGAKLCNGSCTDINSSHVNCGACDVVCPSGQVCSSGHCTETCGAGLVDCGGDCIDVAHDPHHCGACTNDCGPSSGCAAGHCFDVCGT